jgi:hypothetical protein
MDRDFLRERLLYTKSLETLAPLGARLSGLTA